MKKFLYTLLIAIMAVSILAACGISADQSDNQRAESSQKVARAEERQTEKAAKSTTEAPKEDPIDLSHAYSTKFAEKMAVTYPDFVIRYPDGWTLSDNAVDTEAISEAFTLTSKNGAKIFFNHLSIGDGSYGSKAASVKVEISKIADSSFVPGVIQDTDLSDLGSFAVMKVKTTKRIMYHGDGTEESESIDMPDSKCAYAVLPESKAGDMDCNQPDMIQLAFDYGDPISLVAYPPEKGGFTDQDMKEAIAILRSFKAK